MPSLASPKCNPACSTKSFIIPSFSRNFTSQVTFVRLAHTVGYVVTRIIASTRSRYFNLKFLSCCECSVEVVLKIAFGE